MPDTTIIVFVVQQVNFLLFCGPDGPLSVAAVPILATLGYAGFGVDSPRRRDVHRGCMLDAMV